MGARVRSLFLEKSSRPAFSLGPRLFVPVPIWCSTEANGIGSAFTLSFAHLPVRWSNDGTLSRSRRPSIWVLLVLLFHSNRPEEERGPVVCSARRHLGAFGARKDPHSSFQRLSLCPIRRHLLLCFHSFICFAVQSMPPMAKFVAKQIPLTHSFPFLRIVKLFLPRT